MADADPQQLVELRSYTLAPGAADAFARHFEDHLVAGQEQLGMDLVGRFVVPGDDARFVWVRRYLDPANRGAALAAFYGGPVWAEFGPRANELMLDHTDVHLLVPDPSGPSFAVNPWTADVVVSAVYDLTAVDGPRLSATLVAAMDDAVRSAPVDELGRLVTAHAPNDFPRLPVHEDIDVAVWLLTDHDDGRSATALAREVATACRLALHTTVLTPTTAR
jgi:hypothetical protein